MSKTLRDKIAVIISEDVAEGISSASIADRIIDLLVGMAPSKRVCGVDAYFWLGAEAEAL